jgi:hypothetical protein
MELLEQKVFVLLIDGKSLSLQALAPMNSEEREELRKLEERGLTKFFVIDTASSYLLHKSVVQKVIRNLLAVDDPDFEFADRSQNSHGIIRIKALSISVRKRGFTKEEYEQLIHDEKDRFNQIKKRYFSFVEKLKHFKQQQPISHPVKRSA